MQFHAHNIFVISLLLKLDCLVDSESKAQWLPTDTTVAELISSVTTWQTRRSELRKLFGANGFYSDTKLQVRTRYCLMTWNALSVASQVLKNETANAEPLHYRDDLTLLNALCKGIESFNLRLLVLLPH
jgi:hypothetical protein